MRRSFERLFNLLTPEALGYAIPKLPKDLCMSVFKNIPRVLYSFGDSIIKNFNSLKCHSVK